MRRLLGSPLAAVASLRAAAYASGLFRRSRLAGPVVSVGNLGVGGSGKTPVVRRVAELLREAGEPVAILSRGYGGRYAGDALIVSDGVAPRVTAEAAGDEPVMLARALPGVVVAVGARRDVVGRAVERLFGRRVHVLDDGFQHHRLARDLDIVCLDVHDLEDHPLPAGRLREGKGALARADVVLLTRTEAVAEPELTRLESRLGHSRTHRVERRVRGFRDLQGADAVPPKRLFALAAIARPERFARDLQAQGSELVGQAFFRDHHLFRADEIRDVVTEARRRGAAAIVTTAKDAVRLEGLETPGLPFFVLEIVALVSDEERFRERLLSAVRRPS